MNEDDAPEEFYASPAGQLITTAYQFLSAARELRRSPLWKKDANLIHKPTLHLICHGIELILKYGMVANINDISETRKYKHYILKLWRDDKSSKIRSLCLRQADIVWEKASSNPAYEGDDFSGNPYERLDRAIISLSIAHTPDSDYALRYVIQEPLTVPKIDYLLSVFHPVAALLVKNPTFLKTYKVE